MLRRLHNFQRNPNSRWQVTVSPPELTPKTPIPEQAKNLAVELAPHVRRLNWLVIAGLTLVVIIIPVSQLIVNRFWCAYVPSIEHCAAATSVTASGVPSGSFTALGTNTYAAQQTTTTGKVIATLLPWQGKIYMGYGDYSGNTGPIHIMAYDPLTGALQDSLKPDDTSFTSDTEAVYNLRAINGALYALAMDPKGSQCGFFYAKTTDGVHWQDVKGLAPLPDAASGCPPNTTGNWTDAEHVFDMATMNGSDLWVVGSSLGKVNVNGTLAQGISGAVWRSTDDGVTWTKMLETQPTDYLTNPYDYTRYYSLGAYQGKMYVQAVDVAGGTPQPCRVFDGSSWATCPDMITAYTGGGWSPIVFASKLVFRNTEKVQYSLVKTYDGTSEADTGLAAYDLAADEQGKILYALGGNGISATSDLVNWTKLSFNDLPSNARSIAVANNILYIGTADSQLYATSLIPARGPTAQLAPTVSSGPAPLSTSLGAYASTGGTSPIASYSYIFGDGTSLLNQTQKSVNHTYVRPGVYTATLTVTDVTGLSASNSQTVTVSSVPPRPALSLSTSSGVSALSVSANASGTTPGTNAIADYMFDFGDGTTVGPQISSTASHIYTQTGTFVVTLAVRDTTGLAATTTETVTINPPAAAYTGQYYANASLGGTPLTRSDASINFNWGSAAPMSGIPANHFSARWTRAIPLDAGSYKFSVTADDGVRLYIDGVKVIDKWITEGATTYTVTKTLGTGNHTIVMEYVEFTGNAVAKMNYSLVSRTIPAYQGQYFANNALSGTPMAVRDDASINFNWGSAAPMSGLPTDNFSVRWTSTPYFSAGTYRFQTTTDDGTRLYIDNQLIINHWVDGSSTNVSYKQLAAGYHTIRMEYFDGANSATAQLSYYLFDTGTGAYQATYWNTTSLSGSAVLVRSDSMINFNWSTGSPSSAVHADNFSARWTKIATFTAGNHTFTTTTDDGVRLYIDDQLVINKWVAESPTKYSVTQSLTAGTHTVRMEYFEKTGGAVAKLSYN